MKMQCGLAVIVACAITSVAWGQQSASANSAEGALSLAATMRTIQKELSGIGKLSFVVHVIDKEEGNSTGSWTVEIGKVVADPASCTIRYHKWDSTSGGAVNDEDDSLGLRDVLGISAISYAQLEKKKFEAERASPDEKQTYFMEFDPPMFMVAIRTAGDNEEGFVLTDEKKAGQLAKDLGRAVELCGGKNVSF